MSVMTCHRCNKFEDTDFFMGLFVLDRYYFCEKCVQTDDLFEIVDKMQEEIDKKHGMIDWAANCAVDYIMEEYSCQGGTDFFLEANEEVFKQARHAHEQIKDDAADFGTQAHLLCQLWLEGNLAEYDDLMSKVDSNSQELTTSFVGWAEKNKIEAVHTEIKLHGDGYSGRCDLIAYRTDPKTGERRLGLYDIKTGKGSYYPEWGLQLAAYAEAYGQMYNVYAGDVGVIPMCDIKPLNDQIQEIGIIKLNKDALKCNFSEQSKPKFTADRDRLTCAWKSLVKFYWDYNDLAKQFEEIQNKSLDNDDQL